MVGDIVWAVVQIFCVFGLGWLARHFDYLHGEDIGRWSRVAIDFLVPCLVFSSTTKHFATERLHELWPLPVIAFAIVLCGTGIGALVRLFLKRHSLEQRRTLHHLCAVNNAIFLPVIIVDNLWGEAAVANLFFFSLGAALGLWTIGVALLGGGHTLGQLLRHLLTPTQIALLVALTLCLSEATAAIPGIVQQTTAFVGDAAIPIVLFLVGASLYPLPVFQPRGLILLGTCLRLIGIPLVLTVILQQLPLVDDVYNMAVVNAFMPAAAISTILTYRFGGDPQLAAGTVVTTTLLALVTVPLGLVWALA